MSRDLCSVCGIITELQEPPAVETRPPDVLLAQALFDVRLAQALMLAYELGRQGFEVCAMHCGYRPFLKVARELVRAKAKKEGIRRVLHSVPNADSPLSLGIENRLKYRRKGRASGKPSR